jgi:hypothetical protein
LNFILSLIAVVFFICAGVPLALLFTMLDWIGYRDDRVMGRYTDDLGGADAAKKNISSSSLR